MSKKNKKAVISIVFVSLLILLSGCQTKKDNEGDSSGTKDNKVLSADKALDGTTGEKELSICYDDRGTFIEAVAEKYQELNKDVTIVLNKVGTDTVVSENVVVSDTDKFKDIVNTSLASGTADDIIISPQSINTLGEKGLVADLNEYIDFSFLENEYFTNLIDLYQHNGKRYTVPLGAMVEGFLPDYKAINELGINIPKDNIALDDLINISEQIKDKKNVMMFDGGGAGMSDVSLATIMYSLNENDFVNRNTKEVDINNDKFINILETVKKISDRKQIYSHKSLASGNMDEIDSYYNESTKSVFMNLLAYTPTMCSNGTMDYTGLVLLVNDNKKSMASKSSALPVISSSCENKELAGDFIKFLLSEEVLSELEIYTAPVNKKASEKNSFIYYESAKNEDYFPKDFDEDNVKNNIKIFNEALERHDFLENKDSQINEFLYEELGAYYAGNQSSKQTAENLQNKIQLYMLDSM